MNNNIKYVLIIVCFIILSLIGYYIIPKDDIIISQETSTLDKNTDIFVHIEGEVNNPGLIQVSFGTRLYELIERAGGTTENADLSRVNLASILSDEQKIMIPAKVVIDDEESEENSKIVNINTASKEKLMTLDGIGSSMADKIIKYRQDNGYFNSIDDLKKVSGIGESKFNELKDNVSI